MTTKTLCRKYRITGSASLSIYHVAMRMRGAKFVIEIMYDAPKSSGEGEDPASLIRVNWHWLAEILSRLSGKLRLLWLAIRAWRRSS